MTKRRAEDILLHDSPSKRCHRPLRSVDVQLQSMAPAGAGSLSPPSLLALLGSRCRKRPYYFEDPECEETAAGPYYKSSLTVQTAASLQDRRSSDALTSPKKRGREDGAGSEAVTAKAAEQADVDTNIEDCTYNSFQYWRVPLPELDLSLLEDAGDHSQTEDSRLNKDSSSKAMEN